MAVFGFRIVAATSADLPNPKALLPGWRAVQMISATGFAIFELAHDNGNRAEWYFDHEGRQSNSMSVWSADTLQAFITAFKPAIQALLDGALSLSDLPEPAVLREFARINPALRVAIADALQPHVLPEPQHIDLDTNDASALPWVKPARLRLALATNLQDRFLSAMRAKTLTWPSPVSDVEMLCTGSITLDNINSLFRFREPEQQFDVYLLATEHMSRVAGFFIPVHEVTISAGLDQAKLFRHFARISYHVLRHLARYAESLIAGQENFPKQHRFATFLRGGNAAHLGHQLWNELSAIDALCAELPWDCLPAWLIPGHKESEIEFYGPIDALFPEIACNVRRGLADEAALTRYAYENRLIVFRATRQYISNGLRNRVMAYAAARAPTLPAATRSFLIGLRVENRTATDLADLCALLIEEAVALYPGCTIVFDGHNSRSNTRDDHVITSHREHVASRSPLQVERDIVNTMRARFQDQSVQILDTLGEPLAISIVWAAACDGFMAIWGAGLAKYRWVANKPGLIVTNQWNMSHRGDLRIYDDKAYMADPTPVIFVPSSTVQDQPSAPMLVPSEGPSYSNFSFDTAAMREHVRAFLERFI